MWSPVVHEVGTAQRFGRSFAPDERAPEVRGKLGARRGKFVEIDGRACLTPLGLSEARVGAHATLVRRQEVAVRQQESEAQRGVRPPEPSLSPCSL